MICLNVGYNTILGLYFGCENSPINATKEDIREYAYYLQEYLHRFPIQWISILFDEEETLKSIKRNSDCYSVYYSSILVNKKPNIEEIKLGISINDFGFPVSELVKEFTNRFLEYKFKNLLDRSLIKEKKYTSEYYLKYEKHLKEMVRRIDSGNIKSTL